MFFKISKELQQSQQSNIQNGNEISCFTLDILHIPRTKMFPSVLFSNTESAKKLAEKHSQENARLKVRYIITDGKLHNQVFISGSNSTIRIDSTKTGKEIAWN